MKQIFVHNVEQFNFVFKMVKDGEDTSLSVPTFSSLYFFFLSFDFLPRVVILDMIRCAFGMLLASFLAHFE